LENVKLEHLEMELYFKNFIKYLISIYFIFICINIIVDPYHLFHLVEFKNFNSNKLFQSDMAQTFKPTMTYVKQPQIIIMGSSKVQEGMNPKKMENLTGRSTYNLGIDGPTIYELLHFEKFAINNTRVDTIILGLDLLMFNSKGNKHNSRFYLPRMQSVLSKSKLSVLSPSEFFKYTLTTQSIRDSILTIYKQDMPGYYDKSGFSGGNPKAELVSTVNIPDIMMYKFKLSALSYTRLHSDFSFIYKDGTSSYDYFREIIRNAYNNNIELILFISPNHQLFESTMAENALLHPYTSWKEQIKSITKEEALNSDEKEFLLLDFSIDKRNREVIPSKEHMHYWGDSYHYSSNYGDEILHEIHLNASPNQ
jgi:hypothetical protein